MEMKLPSASYESKRKAQKEESNDSNSVFKKARHEWQIKGDSSKGNKACQSQTRTSQDLVTHSKLQEDTSSQAIRSTSSDRASYQISHVSGPGFPSHGQSSNETAQRRFNGHPAGTFGTPKSKETSSCVNPVVNDRTKSDCSLETCDITGTNSSQPASEFHLTDRSDIDTNSESAGAFFGLPSVSVPSNSSRRGYNPHSSTNSTDSNEFNSFLAKRQNSHIAKAVVDNAINKTLEDMGVSPDTNTDNFVTGKCNVEDAGISQAIQSQGLIPQHQALRSRDIISQQQAVCNARLAPILSHVTHLSDMVFSERHFQPGCLAETRDIILDQNLTFANNSAATSVSMSSSDLLDQAVSMAISSQGLALQRDIS
ncbi:uncharacterized protein LOC117334680 [Pecten maximus]|uniref:uncharacterized protein LOC117334680 n=1 Tax=Pecten maximus TaxID=6579 RepID=UPI0014585B05|nr:uncharacterized protein LOC117334680 [Pecten maximus]